VGVICALLQNDMRRLLSYHIVSQVGYMVAGAGLATAYGVDGSLLHAVNHMLYKALLFMSVGAVIYAAQTEDLHELTHRGTKEEERHKQYIWKTLPIVTIGVIIGALSISGVPFFSGYVSKYILKHAMYDVGLAEVLLMLASIGTAASFCKLVYLGFFKARARIVNKIPVSVHLAIVGTAALCVILGVYPQLISGLLPYATSVSVYSLEGVWAALRLNIAGVLLFLNLAKLLQKGIYLPPWASIEYVIFAPLGKLILRLFCTYGVTIDSTVNTLYLKSGNGLYQFCQYVTSLDKGLDKVVDGGYVRIGDAARRITNLDSSLDQAFVSGYTHIGDAAQRLANLDSSLDQAFVKGYTHIGDAAQRFTDHSGHPPEISAESYHETDLAADRPVDKYDQRQSQFEGGRRSSPWTPAEWSTKNLNFDSLLLAMLLVVVLIVIFYFGR
ncbi:MAG TPA: proton-conducting transporter membrane subunit, partial [Candidatus Limnocylindrales bacterium]|nr:proton-conducting transporter membrane subunit [Candidatus Limnocylindrales bacterium]